MRRTAGSIGPAKTACVDGGAARGHLVSDRREPIASGGERLDHASRVAVGALAGNGQTGADIDQPVAGEAEQCQEVEVGIAEEGVG